MRTWIYFVRTSDGLVKIGRSRQPSGKRLKQLGHNAAGQDTELELLVEVQGVESDEKHVHRYFAKERVSSNKELFEPSDRLVGFIRWLRDQWYVSVPGMKDYEREGLECMPGDMWHPNESRTKEPPTGCLPGFHGPLDLGERETTGDDFYTNRIVIEAARRVLGGIDLDPASHAVANKVVDAERFYTISDNGLIKEWCGRVWLNPPFSQWNRWVPKILSEMNSGRIECMCVLSAMRTVTAQYFAPLLSACDGICIMHGRIRFWGGKAGDSPDDGHCVFYFGDEFEKFATEFSSLGTCFRTISATVSNTVEP